MWQGQCLRASSIYMPIVLCTGNLTIRDKVCNGIVNRFTNTCKISAYLLICKANQTNAAFGQISSPLNIVIMYLFLKVLTAVNFNRKF